MGVSLLYHLAKEGWKDVVLVEKGELTSGSTWHAAAFIPHFIGNPGMAKIHRYASKLYQELEAETGQATGFHDCGTIRLGSTQNERDWFRRVQGMLHSQGTEAHIIGPEEITKLHPLMEIEDGDFGIYTPGDGHTDPASSTHSLAIGARARGAEIYLRNRVIDVNQMSDLAWEVVTENGTIIAEHVVNAAGCFSPQVGAMMGVKVPIVSVPNHYLVTDTLDEVKALDKETPTVRDPRSSCYYREEQNSLLIGPYEMEGAVTWGVDGIDWSFDTELLPPNMDVLLPSLESAAQRLPSFANAGIKRVVCGPITHVPDLGILIGPAAGLKNSWLCCGSSVGITQGPGAGKYLAQWMVHGQAEIDVSAMDARRFGDWAVGTYTNEKSLQGYHDMFQVNLPGDDGDAGRPVRPTAIYDKLRAKGAVFGEVSGWEVANWFAVDGEAERYSYRRTNWFDPVAAECRAVRESVGIIDRSALSKFQIAGADATSYLEKVLANDLPEAVGDCVVAHALSTQGSIECEFIVTRLEDSRYYLTSPTIAQLRSYDWLIRCAAEFKSVDITDVTEEFGVLTLAGPRSRDVLGKLTDANLDNDAFGYLKACDIMVSGVAVRALRISEFGELGWQLHIARDQMAALYESVVDAGAEFQITDFGLYAANSLRMEKASTSWAQDLISPNTPSEAGLNTSLRSDKNFICADALALPSSTDVQRKLVYLEIDADNADAFGNEQIFVGDQAVGITTSGAFGHTVGKSLAFAYIMESHALSGTSLEVVILGARYPAQVLDAAAYDPENSRFLN